MIHGSLEVAVHSAAGPAGFQSGHSRSLVVAERVVDQLLLPGLEGEVLLLLRLLLAKNAAQDALLGFGANDSLILAAGYFLRGLGGLCRLPARSLPKV